MKNIIKEIMNQQNSTEKKRRNSKVDKDVIVNEELRNNVKSFLNEINQNPSILTEMSRDEQQEYALNQIKNGNKKRMNE